MHSAVASIQPKFDFTLKSLISTSLRCFLTSIYYYHYYYYYKIYTIVIANKLNYHVHYKIKVVKNFLKFAIFTRVLRTIKNYII